MPQTIKLIIDPSKLSELTPDNMQSLRALKSFLFKSKCMEVWESDTDYSYTYQEINYNFSFTQSLLKRKSKKGSDRYDFYDPCKEPLGKGGYGVVYPISGTIKFEYGKTILKTETHKVVKIQNHDEKHPKLEVDHEYQGLLDSGHLHPKPPIFINKINNNKSYLIMDLAEGITLEKILHPVKRIAIKDQIPELTVQKRFELTFAILNAIKSHVVDKNLIHRDIKPLNIIIDFNKSPIKASIIDYGFYLKEGEQDNRRVGTRAYKGFESFVSKPIYSSKIDVYAAGRVLSYLWGDRYKNYYIGHNKDWEHIKRKSTNENLFNDPDIKFFLSNEDQIQIRDILSKMLSDEPDKRPTINETISEFSKINSDKYTHDPKPKNTSYDPCLFKTKLLNQLKVIDSHLILLQQKALNLRERGCIDAADRLDILVNELIQYTELLEKKPEPDILREYQKCCIKEINLAKGTLQVHRDSWWLVAEISTAICLLGVGYFVAVGINYLNTNRIGLFAQTKSDQLVDELKKSVLDFPSV